MKKWKGRVTALAMALALAVLMPAELQAQPVEYRYNYVVNEGVGSDLYAVPEAIAQQATGEQWRIGALPFQTEADQFTVTINDDVVPARFEIPVWVVRFSRDWTARDGAYFCARTGVPFKVSGLGVDPARPGRNPLPRVYLDPVGPAGARYAGRCDTGATTGSIVIRI